MRLISSVFSAALILCSLQVWAQLQGKQGVIDTSAVRVKGDTKPHFSPLIGSDDIQNDIMKKIVSLYELHQLALVAQVDGDWQLALTGYNVSHGRIRSSIRSAGNMKNYWVIRPYLLAETRGYVPSYITAAIIASKNGVNVAHI